ncbi:MAG: MarR family winged helix-turn-helix transcriptional regulator [Bacillota bacterium]
MAGAAGLDVYGLLISTYQRMKKDLHNQLTESGVTWPQFHALYHIGEQGVPAHELAKELNCNASNMTGLIDRMMENDWVYREHSAEDRRIWLIKLTPKGVAMKGQLIPAYQRLIEERMGVLDTQELTMLHALLDKLKNGAREERKP